MSARIAVFGGTTEGRLLAQTLARRGARVTLHVATTYGAELLAQAQNLDVAVGRLNAEEMTKYLGAERFDAVVDATHPFATAVTDNLRGAAAATGRLYLRLLRAASAGELPPGTCTVASAAEAAALLTDWGGRVLLSVGSKELAAFAGIPGARERLFARVLPDAGVVAHCASLGFRGRSLICMQGPFTHEMNAATFRMLGIQTLVTKDSGEAGGFAAKCSAAAECGVALVVIRRPGERAGYALPELLCLLEERLGLPAEPPSQTLPAVTAARRRGHPLGGLDIPRSGASRAPVADASGGRAAGAPRFPLFVSLGGRPVLVVGGGGVAARRVRVLLSFGAVVTVVSPALCPEMKALAQRIDWHRGCYAGEAVNGYALVVAATGARAINRRIGEDADRVGIPVSVADRREESTFWFPAIMRGKHLVAGLVSIDGDHRAVRRAAARIRRTLEENE